jgi:carbonic anhydrase
MWSSSLCEETEMTNLDRPVTIPCPAEFWPQQSPIDLEGIRAKFPGSYLAIDYPDQVTGEFKKDPPPDDHGFNLVLTTDSASIELDGQTCLLRKIHFHARSEHWRGGKDFPLEIHLVHEIQNPKTGSKLAVLGVFVDLDAKSSAGAIPLINRFLSSPSMQTKIANLMSRQSAPNEFDGQTISFNPNHCLPRHPKRFYRYEGSLTTAPFTESVSWLVFHAPLDVLASDIAEIEKTANHTARSLQPLGRRFVLKSF